MNFHLKPKKTFSFFIFFFIFFFMISYKSEKIKSQSKKNQNEKQEKTQEERQKEILQENSSNTPYISLLFAGDTHFSWQIAEIQKKESLLAPVHNIQPILKLADFRCLNLETVISNQGFPEKGKSYVFQANSNNIQVLKYLNIDLAILGNNHSMDVGELGLEQMRGLLQDANIAMIGAGANRTQALEPLIKDFEISPDLNHQNQKKNKKRFVFISLAQAADNKSFSGEKSYGVVKNIQQKDLNELRSKIGASTPILVNYHWGLEYFLKPIPLQIKTAHELIDRGVSVIIGHHPHIPQSFEIYKNTIIFYSLGNFLFGSTNDLQRDNIIVILDYKKSNRSLARVRIVPITGRFLNYGHKIRILNIEEAKNFWNYFLALVKEHSPSSAKRLRVEAGIGIIEF